MTEWIAIILTAIMMFGSLIALVVRVSIVVAGNTTAIRNLTQYMEKQDACIEKQNMRLDSVETRVTKIEMVPEIRTAIS
jgi:hypothetical protein